MRSMGGVKYWSLSPNAHLIILVPSRRNHCLTRAMIDQRFTRIKTALPGPKSAAVFAEKEKHVAAPIATYAPFIIKESQGSIVDT